MKNDQPKEKHSFHWHLDDVAKAKGHESWGKLCDTGSRTEITDCVEFANDNFIKELFIELDNYVKLRLEYVFNNQQP